MVDVFNVVELFICCNYDAVGNSQVLFGLSSDKWFKIWGDIGGFFSFDY